MFNDNQLSFLKKKGLRLRWNCHLGFEDSWFTIRPDLTTFKCYPLSSLQNYPLTSLLTIKKLKKVYQDEYLKYRKELVLPPCKDCPYYGLKKNQCSGPCIGYRINYLKNFPAFKKLI